MSNTLSTRTQVSARPRIDFDSHRRAATRARAAAWRSVFQAVWRWVRHQAGSETLPAAAPCRARQA